MPIVGQQPSKHLLMAIILPTAGIAGFVGWLYSGWQTVRRPKSGPVLLDDGLVPVQANYAYRGETVDVRLWQDGLALYATHATLEETCFQQRRIRREDQHHGETVAHTPRILFVAPRFEPPVLREGRTTWRDRGFQRALAVCAGRRPLAPDEQEHHLAGHPQHRELWEWPTAFEIRDQLGRTVVSPAAAAS